MKGHLQNKVESEWLDILVRLYIAELAQGTVIVSHVKAGNQEVNSLVQLVYSKGCVRLPTSPTP